MPSASITGTNDILRSDESRSLEDLRESALKLLDFDEIRQRLADQTTFYEARRLALEIRPSFDPDEVEILQRETADARALIEEIGDLTLQSETDTSESVTRAALGGVLTGNELLAVAESLEVHRRASSTVRRAVNVAPLMAELAELIPDLQEIQRQVRSKITRRGEVSENATPSLRALRSQVRRAYERVNESLQEFMQSSGVRESLQDPIIAVRGDRLVVPVKAERRHRISGIVHDASNTGATVFVEPFSTVELCNQWRELVAGRRARSAQGSERPLIPGRRGRRRCSNRESHHREARLRPGPRQVRTPSRIHQARNGRRRAETCVW